MSETTRLDEKRAEMSDRGPAPVSPETTPEHPIPGARSRDQCRLRDLPDGSHFRLASHRKATEWKRVGAAEREGAVRVRMVDEDSLGRDYERELPAELRVMIAH